MIRLHKSIVELTIFAINFGCLLGCHRDEIKPEPVTETDLAGCKVIAKKFVDDLEKLPRAERSAFFAKNSQGNMCLKMVHDQSLTARRDAALAP